MVCSPDRPNLLTIPAEIRLDIYNRIVPTNDRLFVPFAYYGLRLLCRQLKEEFDHEFAKIISRYMNDEVAVVMGSAAPFRIRNPGSFNETHSLSLSLPMSYILSLRNKGPHETIGTQKKGKINPGFTLSLLSNLSPHIRVVKICLFHDRSTTNQEYVDLTTTLEFCQQLGFRVQWVGQHGGIQKSTFKKAAIPASGSCRLEIYWNAIPEPNKRLRFCRIFEAQRFPHGHKWIRDNDGEPAIGASWDLGYVIKEFSLHTYMK